MVLKKTYERCVFLILLLLAVLLAGNGLRNREQALASRVAPGILRFHVIANSDSDEDQAVKLAVKDFLLETIRADVAESAVPRAAQGADGADLNPMSDKQLLQQYITDHRSALETSVDAFLSTSGAKYSSEIHLETCEFPQKTYGDMTFPAGVYDAVRVVLGNGGGKNFWCVLYPSLCYLDSTHAVVPDASKDVIRGLVAEDDFQTLLAARRYVGPWGGRADTDANPNRDGLPPADSSDTRNQKTEQESSLPRLRIRFKWL